ncbi:hypothetical protein BFL36_05500 [Clavibacter michiganensis]|uniref:Uncharacterized protein n=1 Tax=Clavibacter michiganensis TaxID=28447 RepID=A0A251YLM6_9MICO|nr:hypothetical protein BFL36_05500 [Clavibacter michiganensis]
MSVIRTSRCPTTSARTPTASPGDVASVITRTPPAGSKSVWSTSTSCASSARTNTVCGTVTGRPSDSGTPRTSTRTTPVAVTRPSVTAYSSRCVPVCVPCRRKVPASRSGVICTPGRAGTDASRIAPLPPRACTSGSTVTSRPTDACTTKPSATSGTSPARRTVTTSAPAPSSRPSDTWSATVRVSPPAPASVYTTRPSGFPLTASGAGTLARVRYVGSPSGSYQPPSTSVCRRPPSATVPVAGRVCTGGAFSSGWRTATRTSAVAVPPRPSLTT